MPYISVSNKLQKNCALLHINDLSELYPSTTKRKQAVYGMRNLHAIN